MKKLLIIIGKVIVFAIASLVIIGAYIRFGTEEKIYSCTGQEVSSYYGNNHPTMNGTSVYKNTKAFSYKVIPFGRLQITTDRWVYFSDDAYISDTIVHGMTTSKDNSIKFVTFDRITKEIVMFSQSHNFRSEFNGVCQLTTRG